MRAAVSVTDSEETEPHAHGTLWRLPRRRARSYGDVTITEHVATCGQLSGNVRYQCTATDGDFILEPTAEKSRASDENCESSTRVGRNRMRMKSPRMRRALGFSGRVVLVSAICRDPRPVQVENRNVSEYSPVE